MALVEMCVGITCACMPSAAGFFKNKASHGFNTWSTNPLSMLRSLLRYGRQSNAAESLDKSWGKHATHVSSGASDHHYDDIEMGAASTEELRPGTGRGEIHVRRDFHVG